MLVDLAIVLSEHFAVERALVDFGLLIDFEFINLGLFLCEKRLLVSILSESAFSLQFSALHKCGLLRNRDLTRGTSSVLDLVDSVFKHVIFVLG